ncbi:UDP-N-acetylmuramoyl-L-alanyl-D-glutamate--2,6-diaminopimelate ligase [Tahibacter amnicola]|uniref:UDP-N-acetylmuramoyl-L-alanyl-D-glutamate--2,6-diaminopimelate ligase n=1 Tax=Tahibacter amnicola TaxID=2976241 RepID=A0ABY6BDU4_9GAMM|nr:UDP-N-acetylmuramoyl-L-alanyl-D-glutamate--2,6-diaminopimelate ligase [Tahibacter amnicola]UXI67717.1 UDP-N-acetylmuramoyl-L-alanyl-D-glutamate--2,6-diaminopimelate ligase [Tahibacter amnicola]
MTSRAMRLSELLGPVAGPHGDVLVSGLTLDSRAVARGDAFVALQGGRSHGIDFAAVAIERGAVAILAEGTAGPAVTQGVPTLWIDDLRTQIGSIAARFHGEPTAALQVVGVTGTNGKTSTVQLLAQALTALGHPAASIGTLGAGLHGHITAGERTTPDAISLQRLFDEFRRAGATHVAMEVSSHALEQGRVNAVHFDTAVFTNLTRDHLDYHGTMDAYAAAKERLFRWPALRHAVVNIDDAFGRELAARIAGTIACVRTGIDNPAADVVASDLVLDAAGIRFRLVTPWGRAVVATPLLGRFNVANLLGVIAVLGVQGMNFDAIIRTVRDLTPVNGRMNRLGGESGEPLVVVDYAHTPDALEQALATLRAHCDGRLICVFGCGGERDAGKRPVMGAIAERLADVAIVTDDNPRGEDGDAIVAAVREGFAEPARALVERDRARAIRLAIAQARPGDIVLIAGKGHEPYQEVGGQKYPFDDLIVARQILEATA